LIGEHYKGLYLLTKVVMNSSANEFHNSANVLKDDRSNREVDSDDGNMSSRGCVKHAKQDSIPAKDKKKILKVRRGKLLTSNFDDDRQSSLSKIDDRLSVTTRRKFDEVDDIDVLHQDTMRYSGRNVKLVSKDDTDKYFNKKSVNVNINRSNKDCDVEGKNGFGKNNIKKNVAKPRYVKVYDTIRDEDADEDSTQEVDTIVRIAAADSNSEKTDKSSKKRKITKLLKDQELDTTVEKKRKKEIIKGSARSRKSFSTANQDKIVSLHNRWGHPSIEKMKKGIKMGSVIGAGITYEDIKDFQMPYCEACLKGKMKTDSTPSSITNKSDVNCLEIICSDIKGPFPKRSIYHNKWFILFVCAKSKHKTVYFMKNKTETLEKLMLYKKEFPDMFGYTMKVLQCDQDKMFVDKELKKFCLDNSIKLQTSPPYHHASNGMAERAIQTIMDKVITIMADHNAPQSYWEQAVGTAVYLLNRTPVKSLGWKTPYEVVFKEKPDISHLVPFYSKGQFHLTKPERKNSLSQRSKSCRMVGYYPYGKNQYNILLPDHSITNRRDATFNEVPSATKNDEEKDIEVDYDDTIDEDSVQEEKNLPPVKSDYILRKRKVKGDSANSIIEVLLKMEEFFTAEYDANLDDEIVAPDTPNNLLEALNSPEKEFWIEAILKELGELDSRGVFEEIEDQDGPGMKSKMFYKFKFDQNLKPVFKARLVACGYSQVYGVNYEETFGPTTTTISHNTIMTVSKVRGWVRKGVDIGNAFLEGDIDYDNYMYLPQDLCDFLLGYKKKKKKKKKKRIRVKLNKSLYGIKQAAKVFNEKLNNHLISIGFTRLSCDVCLYTYEHEGDLYYLNVHIDDIVITGPEEKVIDALINKIESGFKRITRSEFKRHLGINIVETENYLKLDQKKYIKDFVEEYLDDGVSTNVKIPMSPTINYRQLQPNENNPSLLPATGKIRYCADKSRPDILFPLSMISTQTEKPHEDFVDATVKLMNYLYSTSSDSLQLGGNDGEIKLFAFSDASYVTDKDARSQLGNCFFLTRDSGAIYSVN
jgi:hypothetical protein